MAAKQPMLAGQCACALLLAAALAGCAWQPPQGAAAVWHPCAGKLFADGGDFYDYLEASSLIRHLERRGAATDGAEVVLAAGGDFYDYLEASSLIRHLERRGKLSPCARFMLAAGFAERRHLAE